MKSNKQTPFCFFLTQLPYHLLVEGIEPFAMNSTDYKTFEGKALEWLGKQSTLRLEGAQAEQLAKDIKLEERAEEFAYQRPWVDMRLEPLALAYLKAKKDGVDVRAASRFFGEKRLKNIWDSWWPE